MIGQALAGAPLGYEPLDASTSGTIVIGGDAPLGYQALGSFDSYTVSVSGRAATGAVGSLHGQSSAFGISGVQATGTVDPPATASVIAAALSNIHIGLAPWRASQTYNTGDRVGNANVAYQCVSSGVSASTGGPTGTASSIADGTVVWKYLSTIDFTTAQAWANSIPATLTLAYVGQLWNDGAIAVTDSTQSWLYLTGHTTTATNTITLKCAPGESFRDSLAGQHTAFAFSQSNGVSITLPNVSNAAINYINIDDDYVVLDGLQIADPNATSSSTIVNTTSSTSTLTLRNCIFDGYAQPSGASIIVVANSLLMTDCLVVDRQGATDGMIAVHGGVSPITGVNNTFVGINNTNGIAFVSDVGGTARNCIFVGYLNGIGGIGSKIVADHCVFSASNVGFGVDGGYNKFNCSASNQFVSATNDFRLTYSSDALEAGTSDLTDLPAGTDVAGTTRPQGFAWDAGAWEFVPMAGAGASSNVGVLRSLVSHAPSGVVGTGGATSFTVITGSNASAAITGCTASSNVGPVIPTVARSITSVVATGQATTPTNAYPNIVHPNGAASTGLAGGGSLAGIARSVLGISAAGVASTPAPSVAPISHGITATGAVSGFTITSAAYGIIGSLATMAAGPVTAATAGVSNGRAASSAAGSLTSAQTASMSGVAGLGIGGAVMFGAVNGTVGLGLCGPTRIAVATFIAGAASVGYASTPVGFLSALPVGISASALAGPFNRTVALTGVVGASLVGNLRAVGLAKLSGSVGLSAVGTVVGTVSIIGSLSNIHVGLSSWAAATFYKVGDRVANGSSGNSNAYECIASNATGFDPFGWTPLGSPASFGASAASGGPTGTGTNITDGGVTWKYLSKIDFTTIQSWADAIPNTPSVPIIGQLWNDGPIYPTAGIPVLTLSGHSTSTTNTITLTCAHGESFRDILADRDRAFAFNPSNGLSIILPNTAGNCNYFDVSDANVIIDGLQIQDSNPTSNCGLLQSEPNAANLIVQDCIFDGYAQPSGAAMLIFENTTIFRNNLVIDRQASAETGYAIAIGTNSLGSIFINNTITNVNNNTGGTALLCNTVSGININRNNYFIGYATPVTGPSNVAVSTDHCVFSQASATYANSTLSDNGNNYFGKLAINQFINPMGDFRTKYSSDGLARGASDSTDLPSQVDISRFARPSGQWDIGAWQLQTLVSTGVATGAVGSFNSFYANSSATLSTAAAYVSVGGFKPVATLTPASVAASGQTASLFAIAEKKIVGGSALAQSGGLSPQASGSLANGIGVGLSGSITHFASRNLSSISASAHTGNVATVGGSYAFVATGGGAFVSAGTLLPIGSHGLSGSSISSAIGTLRSGLGATLIGAIATGQAMPVSRQNVLSGLLASAASGPLSALTNGRIIGQQVIAATGTLLAGFGFVGASGNTTTGSFVAAVSDPLRGSSAFGLLGLLTEQRSGFVAGTLATTSLGTFKAQSSAAIYGVNGLTSFDSTLEINRAFVDGIAAFASLGLLSAQGSSTGISSIIGTSASGQTANGFAFAAMVAPTTAGATGQAGEIVGREKTLSGTIASTVLGQLTTTESNAIASAVGSLFTQRLVFQMNPTLQGSSGYGFVALAPLHTTVNIPSITAAAVIGSVVAVSSGIVSSATATGFIGTFGYIRSLSPLGSALYGLVSAPQATTVIGFVGTFCTASAASLTTTLSPAQGALSSSGFAGPLQPTQTVILNGASAMAAIGAVPSQVGSTLVGVAATPRVGNVVTSVYKPSLPGVPATGLAGPIIITTTRAIQGLIANGSVSRLVAEIPSAIVGCVGLSASSAIVGLDTTRISGISGTTIVAKTITVASSEILGVAATTLIGNLGWEIEGISGRVLNGALSSQTGPIISGIAASGATNGLTTRGQITMLGSSANATIEPIGSLIGHRLTGLVVSATIGSVAVTQQAGFLGTVAAAISGLLSAQSVLNLAGATSVASTGPIVASGQSSIAGRMASIETGTLRGGVNHGLQGINAALLTTPIVSTVGNIVAGCQAMGLGGSTLHGYAASVIGAIAYTAASVVSTSQNHAAGGVSGRMQQGSLAPLFPAPVSGVSGASLNGPLGLQNRLVINGISGVSISAALAPQDRFPVRGISATAYSADGGASIVRKVSGSVALGAVGLPANPQFIAFIGSINGLGIAGNAGPQALVFKEASIAATGAAGRLLMLSLGQVSGIVSTGVSDAPTTSEQVFGVSGVVASAQVGRAVANPSANPLLIDAIAQAGSLLSQVAGRPLSAVGAGIAGLTYGWLVVAQNAALLSAPRGNGSMTVQPVMVDEPLEMDVFSYAQVVQVVYPVQTAGRGNVVSVYCLPQVANVVIEEGV